MHELWQNSHHNSTVYNLRTAEVFLNDFIDTIKDQPSCAKLYSFFQEPAPNPSLIALIKNFFSCSPYLRRLIEKDPAFLQSCLLTTPDDQLENLIVSLKNHALTPSQNFEAMMRVLRHFKQKIALLTALADMAGIWGVMKTTHALTLAADAAVQTAVGFLFNEAVKSGEWRDDPHTPEANSGYIVLGMGKYGAFELNYSSDIDLIVFYDPLKARLREGIEVSQFFVRLTRDLVKLLQERTSDGYVFRTDLRLRPDPGSTQVALSVDAAFIYYERHGQNWERAAYIKARPIAGDIKAGQQFLLELSPFIWRKYLDYAAIAAVHDMKRQIHAHKGHGKIAISGHNIKLGRGGIREIEFFAQTQQLIAGGRQQELRVSKTLDALGFLVQYKWIDEKTADSLEQSYCFLRHVEHRLQMIADEQTHVLPKTQEELERLALFAGFATFDDFAKELKIHLENVQNHYAKLFEDVPKPVSTEAQLQISKEGAASDTILKLGKLGFKEPAKAIDMIRNWHTGTYPAIRSQKVDQLLTEFQTVLIEALSKTASPDQALVSFDRFLANLPAGLQLLSLLKNNPDLLQLVADIMGTAPRLADFLSRHSHVLDVVLDPGFFGSLPERKELQKMIDKTVAKAKDYQDILDLTRYIGQEQAFLIGVRILSASISAGQAGRAYSRLASCLISRLHQDVNKELMTLHGVVAGGSSVVLAMGKLGGMEMTASSDLDLITIYDFDPSCLQSDGVRPISPGQYYSRLTQRLISALTASTSYGNLYDVDMRLRPSGNSGPVATRLESFMEYQRKSAWTWEHMALTRARVIAGPDDLKKKLRVAIRDILCLARDANKIKGDIAQMRHKVEQEKSTLDPWHLKFVRGGIMDLEFITQYYQLIHAHQHPEVLNQNTLRSLEVMVKAGVMHENESEVLIPAMRLYQNLTQIMRLCVSGEFSAEVAPGGLKNLLTSIANEPAFAQLEARLKETQLSVRKIYDQVFI